MDINKYNDLMVVSKKFRIRYIDIFDYINRVDIRDSKIKTIVGVVHNFCPTAEVVINSEKGFFILSYKTIIQMEEIRE